jgi:TATA-binding protein-associated factor Taf7
VNEFVRKVLVNEAEHLRRHIGLLEEDVQELEEKLAARRHGLEESRAELQAIELALADELVTA